MSKILANQIANYGDNSPIEVKEGLNIPAGKPLQASGNAGISGQVLSSTGTSLQWVTPFDGSYTSLTNQPTIPAAQIQSDWNASGGSVAAILNKPIVPPQPSVTVATPSASGNLQYSQGSGVFTFTPPDLSSYASSANVAEWDLAYSWGDHGVAGYASDANVGNWDAAYSWGNHATAGYLTAEADTLDTVTGRGGTTSNTIQVGQINIGSGSQSILPSGANNVTFQNSFTGGQILLRAAGNVEIQSYQGSRLLATETSAVTTGGLSLYYATGLTTEVVRLTTTSTGVDINGNLSVSGTTDIDIEDLNNVDIGGGLSDQQVLKWDAGTSSWKPANDLVGGAQGVALTDLSVTTATAGTAALSYNNTNGVFTFTPPDLSGYLTAETDPVFSAHVASGILQTNINNWTAAYNWGDHSTAGYLGSESDTLQTVTDRGAVTTNSIETTGLLVDGANNAIDCAQGDITAGRQFSGLFTGTKTLKDGQLSIVRRSNGNLIDATYSFSGIIKTFTVDQNTNINMSGDLTTTGKLYYSNNFADLTALTAVNATTYHGMFAHVHAEGHGYFAHAGGWIQMLDTGSSLSELADVSTTAPSTNDVLTWDGSNWGPAVGGSGGANVTISDTAPGGASAGDLWWESDKGRLKIYYNDTDSTQWVDASPPLTNSNVPLYVGELELYNFGTQVQWVGNTGVTVSLRTAEGGGGFQSDYIRVTFPTAFGSVSDYTVQATVYDAGTVGDVCGHSIRRTNPQYFDILIYNLTSSANATQASVAIAVYAI